MPQTERTYTYRGGQKVALEKEDDQFVIRATPDVVEKRLGVADAEQVSPTSSRVTTRSVDLEPAMAAARQVAPTHHAYHVAETGDEFLITDRILVTFRHVPSPEQLDAFAAKYALIPKDAYSPRDYLFQLSDHTGVNPVKLVVKLTEEEPAIEFVDHDLNQRMTTYQFVLPTDPSYPLQWHLHTRLNDQQVDPRSSTRSEEAWQLLDGFGSADVVIGVTDDGCRLDHPDFNSPNKFAGWGYFRGNRLISNADIDANPAEMYKTGANHGTSCAGVIAGEADAVLTVGAAPGCRLLPIQWESDGPSLLLNDSKLLTALNFVADKVDVLSNSWGRSPSNLRSQMVVNRIAELARTGGRRGRGIVFLWAAGNENCPIQHDAGVDVPFTSGWAPDGSPVWVGVETSRQFRNNLVGTPGVAHIAALSSLGQRSHYSNYGAGIDFCAPTSNSHEYRRLGVVGLRVTTTTGASSLVTAGFGGTSSATPLVAGIAGLILSANPALTALDVISILKQTASKDLNMDPYSRTPAAAFDLDTSWDVSPVAPFASGAFQTNNDPNGTWSPWFGHGRVDAPVAVAEAIRRRGGTDAQQQTFRRSSTRSLPIPDNNQTGVRDTIQFEETAVLGAIKVTVDVTHSFIGDLRLTLAAPSGAAVILHNRNGGNADNIRRTFDTTNTPALSTLAGQQIHGVWTLLIQDVAPQDAGTLNRWEIEISGRQPSTVELAESPGTSIPDNRPAGVERALSTTEAGRVGEVSVSVDITHTFIGDLAVSVVSPNGTSVPLHRNTGGNTDNLITTYNAANTPALQSLRGQNIAGAWKLRIADTAPQDIGKLNRWSLRIARE